MSQIQKLPSPWGYHFNDASEDKWHKIIKATATRDMWSVYNRHAMCIINMCYVYIRHMLCI